MGHVTPAPGTNQRRGRPGGHGGTHPVRLLEMLLCPIVGLWGALVAPLRAPLQRGRWPRSVCPPPTPAARPEGTGRFPRARGAAGARGRVGTHGRSRLCVPPPPPPPPAGRRLNNSKPPSLPRCCEPRPWLQSPPAAQPVSPAQGAGAATARGGPGQCRCTRRPRPVRARCVSPQCICLRICPRVRPRVRPRICPRCICPRCICPRSICPRCVPASVAASVPASVPALTSKRRPSTCPARPRPRSTSARAPTRGRLPRGRSAVSGPGPHLRRRRCDSRLRHLRPQRPSPDACKTRRGSTRSGTRSEGEWCHGLPRPQFPSVLLTFHHGSDAESHGVPH